MAINFRFKEGQSVSIGKTKISKLTDWSFKQLNSGSLDIKPKIIST